MHELRSKIQLSRAEGVDNTWIWTAWPISCQCILIFGVLCFHHVMLTWDHALTTPCFSAAISVLTEKTETVQGKIAGSFPRTTVGNRGLRSANILGKTCTVGCNSWDTMPKNMQRLSSPLIGCNYLSWQWIKYNKDLSATIEIQTSFGRFWKTVAHRPSLKGYAYKRDVTLSTRSWAWRPLSWPPLWGNSLWSFVWH